MGAEVGHDKKFDEAAEKYDGAYLMKRRVGEASEDHRWLLHERRDGYGKDEIETVGLKEL